MYKIGQVSLLALYLVVVTANPMPSRSDIYATAATTTSSGADPTFTVVKRRRTHNCNQDSNLRGIEAQAWADAGAMADLANQYDNGNQWQPAMNYWMGFDSVQSQNFYKITGN
jgi:hypothetical protein